MKRYTVKTVDTPDWEVIPKAYIDEYPWGGDYRPVSYAQLAFVPGKGFAVRLTCFESDPKALYHNYNEPVYKDSALEFFAAFNSGSPYYVNLETNSNGAFLAAKRTCRKDKVPLDRIIDVTRIKVKGVREADRWYVEYIYPLDVIRDIFGVSEFPSGYTCRGNFFKCGDETDAPHFGTYNPITAPEPDFHRPECFAEFVME